MLLEILKMNYKVGSSVYAYQTGFGDLVYNTEEYIARREEVKIE